VTDLLDGLIARVFKQRTALGAFLDPAADKLLLTAAFLLLTRYPNLFQTIPMTNRIPLWLTILVISRDVLIVSIALMLNLALGSGSFCRRWSARSRREPSSSPSASCSCSIISNARIPSSRSPS
jgi:phosphatidylglycerophosphate synthase